jgi:hypothetical protein
MAGHRGASTWAAWCSSSHRKDDLVRGAWGRQQNLEVLVKQRTSAESTAFVGSSAS